MCALCALGILGLGPHEPAAQDSPVHPSADGASSRVEGEEEPSGVSANVCVHGFEDLASKKA